MTPELQLQSIAIQPLPQLQGVLAQFPAFSVTVTWTNQGEFDSRIFAVQIANLMDMPELGHSWSILPEVPGEPGDSAEILPEMLLTSSESATSLEEAIDVAISEVVRHWREWL